ncbi:hypothetical protein ACU635_47810 [[Actinomadura] parvosata]|uniref:hypothetical protein n=1 Tax=[Actinomadura] parvosata TaxID=1955412 RepID=UPI00406BFB60
MGRSPVVPAVMNASVVVTGCAGGSTNSVPSAATAGTSAFIVLVSGLLTGRSLGAVVLVLAFGAGMAVTLTAVGIMTVRGTPALAGVAVAIGGCLYLATAVAVLAS